MKEYVVGFLFNPEKTQVALEVKKRPDWQAGRLNGIGGKIEDGETAAQAMNREFIEEANANINDWRCFCILTDKRGWIIHFFVSFAGFLNFKTMGDEEVWLYDVRTVLIGNLPKIPNLNWLIPMALDKDNINGYVTENRL